MEIGFSFVFISDKNVNEWQKEMQPKTRLIKKLIIYTQQKLKSISNDCKNERICRLN